MKDEKRNRVIAITMVMLMIIGGLAILPGSGSATDKTTDVRTGNVLNIAIQDDIKTLNPCKASDVWTWDVMQWFYDQPLRRDQDMEIIPWMAENWTYSPENPRWANLTLRNDIEWHDGVPMDGNDLVFTYNFFAGTPGYGAQVPRYLSLVMPLMWDNDSDGQPDWVGAWVDSSDPYTVHFHLSQPYAYFLSDTLSTLVLPEHIWKDHTGDDKFSWPTDPSDYKNATVGTGIFKFSEWNKTQYADIVANEDYFMGWPNVDHIDTVHFVIYAATDAALMALEGGEIDYIAWSIPPGYLPRLVEDSSITLTQTDDLGFYYMGWNLRKEPFNLLPFRQAMAHCTDKQSIVSHLLLNYGSPGTSVVSPANKPYYNGSVTTYSYDLDAARAILDAQGWNDTDGDGWRELPGIGDREIVLLTPPSDYDPVCAETESIIADSCRAVGLNVTSRPTDFGTIVTKVFYEHDFDAYVLGWQIENIDPVFLQEFFASEFDVSGGDNGIGLHNDTLDSMIENMSRELNETKRIKMAKDIQESVAYNLYYNILYYSSNIEAYRNDAFGGCYAQLGGLLNFWTMWQLEFRGYGLRGEIKITGPEKVSDGRSANFTLKATDWVGRNLSGADLTITASTGNITPSGSIRTDENGIARFVYDANVGLKGGDSPVTIRIKINLYKENWLYLEKIFFITVYPPDKELAGATIDLLQNLTTTEEMKYNGVTAIITISDQKGEPIKGAQFDLEVSPPLSLTIEGNNTTDKNGQSIITIKTPDITAGEDLILSVTPIANGYATARTTALLSIVYVAPSMHLEISVSPETAKTGENILITTTVTNTYTGEPLANVSISLSADEPNATFAANSGTTDANGKFSTTMTVSEIGREAETVRITANANATGYGNVSQVREITINRPKSTPGFSLAGAVGVVALAALLSAGRRKREAFA